jgi:hypothetical protein
MPTLESSTGLVGWSEIGAFMLYVQHRRCKGKRDERQEKKKG